MYRRIRLALALCLVCAIVPVGVAYAAMSTPGQFGVNNMGAGTYAIPIHTPPGTAGIAPQLSLNYNSHGGNGLLGMGWSLSGLSSISRCPKTMAQDGVRGSVNFDANDRYCLDGQRLIVVGGTYGANGAEYRTEQEGFSRIISYGTADNGPAWFKVWTKSGQVMEFGNTADSRIEAQGKATPGVWALNKLQDAKSNYFTVTYTEDAANGTFYPQRIDYTGNANTGMVPNSSVQFIYEARTDSAPLYQAGSMSKNAVRLAKIQTYSGSTLVNDYRLTYTLSPSTQRSRIDSVTECNGTSTCLPSIGTNWLNGGTSFSSWQAWGAETGAGTFDLASCKQLVVADVNGDGKSDLVCPYDYNNGNTATWVQISNGSSFKGWQMWGGQTSAGNFALASCKQLVVADVNGDGYADLVCPYDYGNASTTTFVQISNGTSFNGWQAWSAQTSAGSFALASCKQLVVADVNGDGKSDLVCPYDYGNGIATTFVQISNGTSFNGWQAWSPQTGAGSFSLASCKQLVVADVNGDGNADLVCPYDYGGGNTATFVQISNGASFNGWQAWSPQTGAGNFDLANCKQLAVADVNGDGKSDLVCPYDYGNSNMATRAQISNGTSFSGWQTWSPQTGAGNFDLANCKQLAVADVNGDGKSDLVCPYDYGNSNMATRVQINSGTSFSGWQTWGPQTGAGSFALANCKHLAVIDVNGDGKSDLVCPYDYGNSNMATWVQVSDGSIPDRASSIATGLSSDISLTYKPITDSSVYTKDSGSVYPVVDLQLPLNVVSSVRSSNGIGGTLTTNYTYGGLKADVNRGALGFRWMQSTQLESNLSTRTEFRQDWPFAGMPSIVKKTLPGGGSSGVLSQVVNQYDCNVFGGTSGCTVAPGRIYFPYLKESAASNWDLYGVAMPTIITRINDYDQWGNPKQIVVTNSDGFSTTTDNIYTNDEANWFLGRLTSTVVTSSTDFPISAPLPPLSTVDTGLGGSGAGGAGGTASGSTGNFASTTTWAAGYPQSTSINMGQAVTLKVQVKGLNPISGYVTFADGSNVMVKQSLDVNGNATFTGPLTIAGMRTISASYSGDQNNAPSSVNALMKVNFDITPILMLLLD